MRHRRRHPGRRLSSLAVLSASLLLVAAGSLRAESWLTYERSGGITGWSLTVTVDHAGRVSVAGTREDPAAVDRSPLEAQEVNALSAQVREALDRPPREPLPGMGHLADGMMRRLIVESPEGRGLLLLADGLILTPEDHRLVAVLEALARRPVPSAPAGSPPPRVRPRQEAEEAALELSPPRLDLVVVAPGPQARTEATALLLELPVGRADEPAGRHGIIELLLLNALGPQESVLLDGLPALRDPDRGEWSLSVSTTRTRLLVLLADETPSAARGAVAALRGILNLPQVALRSRPAGELDHHRRRLADAVHDQAAEPRVRRLGALRSGAWGPDLGSFPAAFDVHAIEAEDLLDMAQRVRRGHSRLVLAGALSRQLAPSAGRGFELTARPPLEATEPSPATERVGVRHEDLAAAAVTASTAGPAASLALELALRRQGGSWVERVEPGDPRSCVVGDTLAVVAPVGTLSFDALTRALDQLGSGLEQGAVDVRMRRRLLGDEGPREPTARAHEAADLLELGAVHVGRAELDLPAARASLPKLTAEQVRRAAEALSDSLTLLLPADAEPPRHLDESAVPLLEAARRALFAAADEGSFFRATLERAGRDASGRSVRMLLELSPSLPLRLEQGGEVFELRAGELPAGHSPSAEAEQDLVRAALAEPAVLVAGAVAGLFPVRAGRDESLAVDGRSRTCRSLEILVPARGLYRLLVEASTGDVRAVDRRDPLGRTLRVLMSDIRQDEAGRRVAARQELLSPQGERRLLLEAASLELRSP